jgi:C-terminal processing protease CtpA/Prc
VRLLQFSDNTDQKFDQAIAQLKKDGLNGLILDLRSTRAGFWTRRWRSPAGS